MRDRPVLPKLPPSKLASLDDLLTPEQREELAADLAEIAKCRLRAEDAAAFITLAAASSSAGDQ